MRQDSTWLGVALLVRARTLFRRRISPRGLRQAAAADQSSRRERGRQGACSKALGTCRAPSIDVDYQGSALGTFPGRRGERRGAVVHFAAAHPLGDRRKLLIRLSGLRADRGRRRPGQGREEPDADAKQAAGQPLAAFKIEKHFDIRRDYNPATGEEQNVLVENDTDTRWYERKYMRVDWSKNLLPGYYGQTFDLDELLGNWKREPADLYVQNAVATSPTRGSRGSIACSATAAKTRARLARRSSATSPTTTPRTSSIT